ncbi:MAG: TraR/DksA family transcriptional regulator [Candidatus Pacebacteria bacterium]|jgi:RNA polymerase-binding transcription factor DksA|nr:TraR/DksA family transcriptional regulator [Candidatus Paceibacterota bacterium]
MEKEKLDHFRKVLEAEKAGLEKQLGNVALPASEAGEWQPKYPNPDNDTGHEAEELRASESEEYGANVAVTHGLSQRLADVDFALEKIEKGTYGTCDNCGGEIPEDRLEAFPAARLCFVCGGKK